MSHPKGGKSAKRRTLGSKKGGNYAALMSELATPAVLIAANQMYGKRTRRNTQSAGGRRKHKKTSKNGRKRSRSRSRK